MAELNIQENQPGASISYQAATGTGDVVQNDGSILLSVTVPAGVWRYLRVKSHRAGLEDYRQLLTAGVTTLTNRFDPLRWNNPEQGFLEFFVEDANGDPDVVGVTIAAIRIGVVGFSGDESLSGSLT